MKPDGVFLSNGPGDPAAVSYAIQNVRDLIGKVPIFGICLGHQILNLALGGTTYKLQFGHHGGRYNGRGDEFFSIRTATPVAPSMTRDE